MTPVVTVVIPAYNASRWLAGAIGSVVRQTFQDWELVVVDDGSTDQTWDILRYVSRAREFAEGKLFCAMIGHQGVANALNYGIGRPSKTSLIARLDADDWMAPTRLEQQVAYLAEHPEVGLLGTAAVIVDEDGREVRREYPPRDDATIRAEMPRRNPFIHSSVLFRREVFDQVGGYPTDFAVAQDYALWVAMAPVTQMANLEEPLIYSRLHSDQVTARRVKERRLADARLRWRQGNVLGAMTSKLASLLG